MKNIRLALLILFSASAIFATAQNVVEHKLPKSNKVVLKFRFQNGSISDPAGKEGLTQLTAQTISEGGTSEMTATEIKEFTYPMAAYYYSSVDKEVSEFTFQFHKDWTDDFYPVIKGLMCSPAFDQNDFQRVQRNQQNYVDQVIRASSDEEYSKKALEDFLFRGNNFQHMVAGKSEGVSSATVEDVKAHFKNVFTRQNLTIGIAGNYSADFLTKLKKDLEALPENGTAIPEPGKPKMPKGIEVEIITKENTLGSAIFTGTPLEITRSSDDFAALMVANSWLGEHRKSYSRLYQKIREQRSMNYGDYTYIEWYNGGGNNMLPPAGVPRSSNYFSIWIRPVQTATSLKGQYKELAGLKVGHAHFALRMAKREIDQILENGMSPEEFEATREFLRSYIKLYIQTPSKQLGYLMDSKFYGRTDYIAEMDALLAKLTVEEVNAAVKKYLRTDNMCVTIVTGTDEAKPLKESLLKNLPSPMSYSDDLKASLPAEILEEDDVVAKYPMKVTKVTIVPSAETFR